MTTSTVTTITCDICLEEIPKGAARVNAGVYGRDFHVACLKRVNGTIIGMLVDDVDIEQVGNSAVDATRLRWDSVVKS